MARIFTYDQDNSLNVNDKLLGTNSADNVTKNFTIDSLLELANDVNAIKHFDGIVFKAQDYNVDSDQYGIITTGTGAYTSTNFSAIQTIYLSNKNLKEANVSEYIDVLEGYDVRITNKNDVNNFGIYRVDSVTDSDSGTYKVLTLSNQDASGQLVKGDEYYVSTLGNNLKNLNSFSVTSTNDVTSAGSGQIITDAERTLFNTVTDKVDQSDIVDNLTSPNSLFYRSEKVLSAYQGTVLKGYIDDINTLLTSDNIDLDTLQEVVDYIETNRSTLDALTISNISGLQVALDGKVDVIVGKGLSANDFTDALLTKLQGISDNAEVNAQADWNELNTSSDSFIQNKPTDLTIIGNYSVTGLNDVTSAGSGAIITDAERTKLNGLNANAEQNVQANWTETDTNSDAFIQNKPTILDSSTTLTINGTTNEIEVTGGAQDLTTDRTWTVGLPSDVTIGNNLIVTNNVDATGDIGGGSATITGAITAGSVDAGGLLSLDTALSVPPSQANAIYYTTENSHDILNFRYHGHTLKIDTLTEVIPSGITSGGELSAVNTTQFSIAAGTGVINDLNKESAAAEPYPEIKYISWSTQTITTSFLDAQDTTQKNTWIYIDETGTVQQQNTAFTDAQVANKIIIGSIVHSSGTIDFVKTFPITAYAATAQLAEFARMFGPMKKTGHKVTPNGANLSIDRAAGTAFAFGRNYVNDPNNPSIVSDTAKVVCKIHRYYSDGSTGHTKDTNAGAGYNFLDPTKYDDGDGTLATMNTAKFSVQRLYFFPTTPDVVVAYYGKNFYSSIEEAEKTYLIEDFTEADNTSSQAIYLGAVILKGDATALNNTSQAKFLTAGIFRSLAAVNVGGVAADAVLNDLVDVNISTVADNDIIRYDSANGQWLNEVLTTDGITEGSINLYDKTVTLTEGSNVTITGTYPDFTIASAHPIIAGASDSINSGLVFIQSLGFDSNGHVTSVGTGTLPTDVNTTYTIGVEAGAANTSVIRLAGSDASTDDITISGGSNVTVTEVGDTITIASSHPSITAASSVDNSGYTYIQDITLDSNGHVTGITSDTISTAAVTNGSTSLVTGDQVYDFVIAQGYSTTTGTVDTANSPGTGEFAKFTDGNTIEGRTASELKADLNLEIGTDIQAYDADLTTLGGLAKTDGNFIVGNGTTWVAESGNTARTSLGLGTGNSPTFAGLTVNGNLTVSGTTTTVNSNTVNIGDNILTLNSDETAAPTQNSGLEIERGTSTNARLIWDEFNDYWVAGLAGSENKILTTADEGAGNGIDSDTLDGQHGSYYLNYNNFTNTPTIPTVNNATLTVNGSGVLGGSGTFTANQGTNATISITHDNVTRSNTTSSANALYGGTFTAIDSITTSSQGHITAVNTKTVTMPSSIDTTNFNIQANTAATTNISAGETIRFQGSGATTVSRSNNTLTFSSTNTTYSAGTGLSLNNGAFSIQPDLRDGITHIGYDSNDYIQWSNNSWCRTVVNSTERLRVDTAGIDVSGRIVADADITAYSDERLKKDVKTIDNALEKTESLRGVEFTRIADDSKSIGVIAQELEKVLPELVLEDEDGMKSVNYGQITGLLIEAVKELSAEVKELKKQINA